MTKFHLAAALAVGFAATAAAGNTDARYASVKALGELNGIALQCRFLDQVRRMKAAVVKTAPKERSFGLAFDEATNEAYLEFIHSGRACPERGRFESRVGERIDEMRRAFAAS